MKRLAFLIVVVAGCTNNANSNATWFAINPQTGVCTPMPGSVDHASVANWQSCSDPCAGLDVRSCKSDPRCQATYDLARLSLVPRRAGAVRSLRRARSEQVQRRPPLLAASHGRRLRLRGRRRVRLPGAAARGLQPQAVRRAHRRRRVQRPPRLHDASAAPGADARVVGRRVERHDAAEVDADGESASRCRAARTPTRPTARSATSAAALRRPESLRAVRPRTQRLRDDGRLRRRAALQQQQHLRHRGLRRGERGRVQRRSALRAGLLAQLLALRQRRRPHRRRTDRLRRRHGRRRRRAVAARGSRAGQLHLRADVLELPAASERLRSGQERAGARSDHPRRSVLVAARTCSGSSAAPTRAPSPTAGWRRSAPPSPSTARP